MTMVFMGTIGDRSRRPMAPPDLTRNTHISSSREAQKVQQSCFSFRPMDMIRPHPRTRSMNHGSFGTNSYDLTNDSSSTSSSESDNSSTTSSTSRKRTTRARKLWLRQEVVDVHHQQIPTPIYIGYSLRCYDDDDDRSLSSLSGYGTDYSTSEGSVGFEDLCDSVESSNKVVVEFDTIVVNSKSKIRQQNLNT
jgi:hypothetical protein